MLYTN